VPLPVRALLSVVLAFLMLPVTQNPLPDPFSLAGVVAMIEQAVIGGVIGFALQPVDGGGRTCSASWPRARSAFRWRR
jgi:flagellar biosynthesis protein FliR